MIPNELKILNFSLYLFVYFLGNIIMTGEPTHTTSMKSVAPELMFLFEHVPHLSITDLKVRWSLHFTVGYVQPVTQCYK